MASIKRELFEFVNDNNYFEEKKFVFREVWGIDPETGKSASHLNYADTQKKDPLSKGVSLDMVYEDPGGVSDEMEFPKHSLFQLKSCHDPTYLAEDVSKDISFTPLSDKDYEDLQRLSDSHQNDTY